MKMKKEIKNKVRQIQHKYCGEPVETKLYHAIKETEKSIIKNIQEFNEETYGHCKDSCESQEYDAINNLIEELNSENKPKTK